MGIIQAGILSPVSGKVAGVVGGKWKDKAYLRSYVIPANPNTASQQAQRTKFSDCVDFAKPLVGQCFNSYTDKFIRSMSGFNFFIKRNIAEFDGAPVWSNLKLTEGPLSAPIIGACSYISPNITIPWTKNLGNNGLDTDKVFAVVYDKSTGIFAFAPAEADRFSETMSFDVGAGLVENNQQCYIWAAQYVATVLVMISNSDHDEAV